MRSRITLRQWYYAALAAPIALPGALYLTDASGDIATLFLIAFFYGGAQYVVFALWVIWYYRKATTRELFWFSFKAPFYFIPFCYAGLTIYILLTPEPGASLRDDILVAGSVSMACIPFGYVYVILTHILTWAMRKSGFLKE